MIPAGQDSSLLGRSLPQTSFNRTVPLEGRAAPRLEIGRAMQPPMTSIGDLPPIPQAYRELQTLVKDTLVQPLLQPIKESGYVEKATQLNTHFSWTTSKVSALFSAMYSQGVVTEEDAPKIKELLKNIDDLEKEMAFLPKDAQQKARVKLEALRKKLGELKDFGDVMERFVPIREQMDRATERLSYCLDEPPLALMAQEPLQEALKAIHAYTKQVAALPPSIAKTRLEWDLEKEIKFFSFNLMELKEVSEDFIESEIRYFSRTFKRAAPSEKEELARQILSLMHQQDQLLNGISTLEKEVATIPILAQRLKEMKSSLNEQKQASNKLWEEVGSSCNVAQLPSLKYGSDAWLKLVEKRPAKGQEFFENTFCRLHPEKAKARELKAKVEKERDDRTRVILNRIFLGMQLLTGAQWLFQTLPQQAAALKIQADRMAVATAYKQLQEKGTHQQQAELQQHLLILEGVLNGYLTVNAEQFSELQNNMPQLARYLQKISGGGVPTARIFSSEALQQKLMEYARLYVAKTTPTKPLSFAESLNAQGDSVRNWWTQFTTPSLSENLSLVQAKPDQVKIMIEQQSHLVGEALKWQGDPKENPFLKQIQEKLPATAEWVQQWTGKNLPAEAIQEMKDFYQRSATNGYIRFAYAAEAASRARQQSPEPSEHRVVPWMGPPPFTQKPSFPTVEPKVESVSKTAKVTSAIVSPPSVPKTQSVSERKVEVSQKSEKGWMAKMMGTVSGFFTTSQAPSSLYPEPNFSSEKREEGKEKLEEAWKRLSFVSEKVESQAFNEELSDLRQAILRNVQEAPSSDASLPELATWLQRVDDMLYGVDKLEQHVAQNRGAVSEKPEKVAQRMPETGLQTVQSMTSAAPRLPNVWNYLGYSLKWAKVGIGEKLLGPDPLKVSLDKNLAELKEKVLHMDETSIALSDTHLKSIKNLKELVQVFEDMLTSYQNSVETDDRQVMLMNAERTAKLIERSIAELQKDIHHDLETKRSHLHLQALLDSPVYPVSAKLFQHVLGGQFGRGTGLESYEKKEMLHYMLQLVVHKMEGLESNPLCQDKDKDAFCRTLLQRETLPEKLFATIKQQMEKAQQIRVAFESDRSTFVRSFTKATQDIKEGESFFFQGGWTQQSGGHAIVYEVIKQKDGLFTFRVYNRGEGIGEFYTEAIVAGKHHYLPFTEILDVSPERLTAVPFLAALQELDSAPVRGEKWSPSDLYAGILPLLGGRYSHRVYDVNLMQEALEAGHCSYLSLTAFLSPHLGDQPTYSRWELEIQFKTLSDFFNVERFNLSNDEQARRLFREGIAQFGRNIDEASKKGLLTKEELAFVKQKVAIIKNELEEASRLYQAKLRETAPVVSLNPLPVNPDAVSIHLPEVIGKEIATSNAPTSYIAADRSNWTYRPEQFQADMKHFIKEIEEARKLNHEINIKEGIKDFIAKVPLEGDVFWQNMSLDQARETLSLLSTLSREHLYSVMHISSGDDERRQHRLFAEDFLAQAKILTLTDAVLRHFKDQLGFEIPGLYQPQMAFIVHGASVDSMVDSAQWNDERRTLRNYWDRVDPPKMRDERGVSFFGFEKLPGWQFSWEDQRKVFEHPPDAAGVEQLGFWGIHTAWPDVEFAKKWIERPEIAAKIAEKYPELKDAPPTAIAMQALADRVMDHFGGHHENKILRDSRLDILPPEFFQARDIAYATHQLLVGLGNNEEALFNQGIKCDVSKHTLEHRGLSKPYWAFGYRLFGMKIYDLFTRAHDDISTTYPNMDRINPLGRLYRAQYMPQTSLIAGNQYLESREVQAADTRGTLYDLRRRIEPHDRIVIQQRLKPKEKENWFAPTPKDNDIASNEITADRSSSDLQELLALSSVPELQVQQTLAYYSQRLTLFQDSFHRELFQFLMTEGGYLIDEFLKNPEHAARFSKQLATLCEGQYRFYKTLGDVSSSLYFLDQMQRFADYAAYTQKTYPGSFPKDYVSPFIDVKAELQGWLASRSLKPEDKSSAYFILSKIHAADSVLSPRSLVDLIKAGFQFQIQPLPRSNRGPDAGKRLDLLRSRRGEIEKLLSEPGQRDAILNEVLKEFRPGAKALQWRIDGAFPRFLASDGSTAIDLIEGTLLEKGKSLAPLSDKLRSHLDLLFGKEGQIFAAQVDWGVHEFRDSQGSRFRLIEQKEGRSLVVQRELEGRWYQLESGASFSEQLPYPVLFTGHQVWVSGDPHPEAFVADSEDHFKYRFALKKAGGKYEVEAIHLLDSEEKDSGLVLADIYRTDTPFSFLERFEDKGQTLVWVDQTNRQPALIDLPRFGLAFDIKEKNGKRLAYCRQHPGYYLAERQLITELGDMSNYLVLEKLEKGEKAQMALMPKQQLVALNSLTLITKTDLERNLKEEKPQRYFAYDLKFAVQVQKTKEAGVLPHEPRPLPLKPRGDGARFHLAMMQLWERDYEAAMRLLRGFGTQLKSYSADEIEGLQWIQELAARNQDHTPQAKAVRLYTDFLTMRDALDSGKLPIDSAYLKQVAIRYEMYLQALSQLSDLTQGSPDLGLILKPEEEQLFLKHLPLLGSLASHRLLGVGDPQSAAAFSKMPSVKWTSEILKRGYEQFLDEVMVQVSVKTKQEQPEKASLLRAGLSPNFLSLYASLKNKDYTGLPALIAHYLGEAPTADTPVEQLKEQALQVLWLARNRPSRPTEAIGAALLGSVIKDPEKALPLSDLESSFRFLKHEVHELRQLGREQLQEKWLAPAMHVAFYEVTGTPQQSQERVSSKAVFPLKAESAKTAESQEKSLKEAARIRALADRQGPLISDWERYLVYNPPNQEGLAKARATGEALRHLFDVKTNDNVANRKFAELKKQFEGYPDKVVGVKGEYQIRDFEALHGLKVDQQRKASEATDRLIELASTLNKMANKPYADPKLETEREMRRAGGKERAVSIQDLLLVFRTQDRSKLHALNPALTAQDIDAIYTQTKEFLIQATSRQQQLRLIEQIGKIEDAKIKNVDAQELQVLLRDLATQMQGQRAYQIAEHPENLNLEHILDLMIHPSQAEHLEHMGLRQPKPQSQQELGVALEAIPGSGKTSILLTLQAQNDANGKDLALVVMPESLMPQMSAELQERLGAAYEQSIEIMAFDRETRFDRDSLQRIKDRLDGIIAERKALLMTDSSVQSFFLKFAEKVVTMAKARPEKQTWEDWAKDLLQATPETTQIGEIQLFRQIFATLRSSGVVTLDEMDLILDILKAHHFTLGEPQAVKPEVVEVTTDFYLQLALNPQIREKMHFNFLQSKEGTPFDTETYAKEIQPLLVEDVIAGKVGKEMPEFTAFLRGLSSSEQNFVRAYLNNKATPEASRFVDALPSMQIKNALAVLKEEISRLIPLTAKKQVNEHYGPLPEEAKKVRNDPLLAIPYHGSSNPVSNAQFGTELEILNYTIQMHLIKGISLEIVGQEIENIKAQVASDLQNKKIKKLKDSPAYNAFVKLCGGSNQYQLFNLSQEQIKEITALVNQNPAVQIDLIKRYVLPQLKVYPNQLSTSGQIYGILFKRVKGFTGTLWNADAFPRIFGSLFESDTMVRTLSLLWDKSPQKVATIATPRAPESQKKLQTLVESLYKTREGFKGSFADAAGIFREFEDNELVAREILKHQKTPIDGIAYYSKDKRLMVLVRGQPKGVPIEQCGLSKDQIVAFWDQKNTTGSDIKLGATMVGTVTVGQHTMIRDLVQAVWRLRGLEQGQKVDFVVMDEDAEIIRNTLKKVTGEEVGEQLELRHLLIYTLYNQAMRQGDDNHRSFQQKMRTVLLEKVLETIVDPKVTVEEMLGLMEQTQELFSTVSPQNPYEQYGRSEEYASSKDVVEQELKDFMASSAMQAFKQNPVLSTRYSAEKIEGELKALATSELPKLPQQLVTASRYERQVAVQMQLSLKVEAKKEVQTEMNLETKRQRQVEKWRYEEHASKPRPVVQWSRDHLFEKQTFTPTPYEALAKADPSRIVHSDGIRQQGLTPTLGVSDSLAHDALTQEYASVFDAHLLATLNFMPIYPIGKDEPVYHPFGRYEDIVSNTILVEDKATGELQLILADQADAKQVDQLLAQDVKDPTARPREVRTCLYNIYTGEVTQGKERFDSDALEKNPQLIQLRTQAKFFGGALSYTDDEIKYLERWIQEKGPDKMYTLFFDIILQKHSTKQASFPYSDIEKVFTRAGVK